MCASNRLGGQTWGGLAQEATKKYRGPAGRNNRHVFPTILEVEKSKFKGPADSVSGENPLSGWQMAIFSLWPHMAEGSSSALPPSCRKDTNSIMVAPPP